MLTNLEINKMHLFFFLKIFLLKPSVLLIWSSIDDLWVCCTNVIREFPSSLSWVRALVSRNQCLPVHSVSSLF